jgi:3-phosphoshikimate 1-carboxyvinyltransferase
MSRVDWMSAAGGPLRGEIAVPGDKSVSHRALMFGAIAEGVSHIRGFLEGEDTRATAAILGKLGVRFETPASGEPAWPARQSRCLGLRQRRYRHAPAGGSPGGPGVRFRPGGR